MNVLVIIESPHKAPVIKNFLGKGYKVVSSVGHVRDLPKSKFGVDIENDFEPQYINIRGRGELINSLKKEAKAADLVLLATDPDREGEAISWHLKNALNLPDEKVKRVTFNTLIKSVVKDGIKNPRQIDMNLVDSQQARRVLDRIVGYKISPLFWKNIRSGLSAGRVQSVATRLIVEREKEIRSFIPSEYWNLTAALENLKTEGFNAKFYGKNGKKVELKTKDETDEVISSVKNSPFKVNSITKALKHKKPAPPYNTSSLQQDANRKLGFQSQRTMKVAQELYEGMSLGTMGTQGLITYMRTDSLRVADDIRAVAKDLILEKYGENYYPETPNIYKSKASSQDAHEAIRPADVNITPDMVKAKLSADQFKLYKLIWDRFVASQMASAQYDTVTADIVSAGYNFRAGGYTIKFPGYLAVMRDDSSFDEQSEDGMSKGKLPELKEGETLKLNELKPEQKFTQPPSRYTEASLVKVFEELGIARPSTYAQTISTIIARGYVKREAKTLYPTELGELTTEMMIKTFPDIVDYDFTAKMEEDLDKIAEGEESYLNVVRSFYGPFEKSLKEAEKTLGTIDKEALNKPEETDLTCDNCGATMVVKNGRYGKFAACPNYPKCKSIKPLNDPEKDGEKAETVIADEKCELCGKDMVLKSSRYGKFYACTGYPECKNTRAIVRDTGAKCPDCGKRLIVKQGKARSTFYSCEGYPECKFSTWDRPMPEKCPNCGGLLLKSVKKKQIYCHNTECGYNTPMTDEAANGENSK